MNMFISACVGFKTCRTLNSSVSEWDKTLHTGCPRWDLDRNRTLFRI